MCGAIGLQQNALINPDALVNGGPGHNAAVAVISAPRPEPAEAYHARLQGLAGLSHVTVEVQQT